MGNEDRREVSISNDAIRDTASPMVKTHSDERICQDDFFARFMKDNDISTVLSRYQPNLASTLTNNRVSARSRRKNLL